MFKGAEDLLVALWIPLLLCWILLHLAWGFWMMAFPVLVMAACPVGRRVALPASRHPSALLLIAAPPWICGSGYVGRSVTLTSTNSLVRKAHVRDTTAFTTLRHSQGVLLRLVPQRSSSGRQNRINSLWRRFNKASEPILGCFWSIFTYGRYGLNYLSRFLGELFW